MELARVRGEDRRGSRMPRFKKSSALDSQNSLRELKKIGGEGRDSNPTGGVNHHSPKESGLFALPTATSPGKPQLTETVSRFV